MTSPVLTALAATMSCAAALAQTVPPPAEPEQATPPSDSRAQPTAPTSQPSSPSTPPADTRPTGAAWPQFGTLDSDGDGALSRDEARSNSTLSSQFAQFDEDQSGTISDGEYARAQTMRPGEDQEPR